VITERGSDYVPVQSPTFHVLGKPTGAICNLDCKYCFFLSKEEFYPKSSFRMSEAVLESYLKQQCESQHGPEISISWQGGEPTLIGLDFYKHSIELVAKHKTPTQTVQYTIQTNGVLLDDEWCAFFKQHHFLVGLSIDGPRHLHDAYRVDKRGRPTFERVMAAARLLQAHNVEFNVLCTVNAANGDYPLEVYRFFRDELKTQFIQFIPIVERVNSDGRTLIQEGTEVTDRSVTHEQWGRFLTTIFDEWVRRDVGSVFIQMFDAALAAWVGVPQSLCIFAETCGQAVALEHNGDLYSCDHFVEPKHLLGNITETRLVQLVSSKQQLDFGKNKLDSLPKFCLECPVRFACHGECPKNRFIQTPDGEVGLNYLCAGYKAFFTHVDKPMRIMAQLLQQGRFADEVMTILNQDSTRKLQHSFTNTPRNDRCPCNSGLKYKRCHGRQPYPGELGQVSNQSMNSALG